MADHRWRARALTPQPDVASPLAEVLGGVAHHLEADRWFHPTPEFTEGERETADALRNAGARAPKITLFAHAAWEMCLDGAWVRRVGTSVVQRELETEVAALRSTAHHALVLHVGEGLASRHRRAGGDRGAEGE